MGKEKGSGGGGGKPEGGGKSSSSSSRKKGGGDAGGEEDLKRDQKLQAIVLADSFMKTFRPITWEKPKVLLPLANVPMLDYTVEFLAQNSVKEVFVFCVWHAEILQQYIKSKKWPSSITVTCLSSSACLSAGDALREIDSMGVIRSDPFILISGDVVSNMNLKAAIDFHRERKRVDNNAIMTVALKKVQNGAGIRPVMDDLVVAMDRSTQQLLLFENDLSKKGVSIPLELMAEHPGLALRSDLLDCQVDICSPELLLQFSDNFDYQNIRNHFIKNEVVNWELGMHIYGYVLDNEYAARVHDPHTYHHISRDIVTRWVYPMVPDLPVLQDSTQMVHTGRYIYRDENVRIARSARVESGVVLGRGTIVEENAYISRSVIGKDCVIGAGAVITDSHLWEGVTVQAGAKISHSILCDKVVVKRGASVPRGCMLSFGVVVGQAVAIPEYTRLSRISKADLRSKADRHGSEDASASPMLASYLESVALNGGAPGSSSEPQHIVAGADGYGFVWEFSEGDDYTDFVDGNSSEDEDEKVMGPVNPRTGKPEPISVLKASSMGCNEEEAWKMTLRDVVPPPVDEQDSDEDEDGYDDEDGEEGEGMEGAEDFFGGGDIDVGGSGRAPAKSPKADSGSSKGGQKMANFERIVGDMVQTGFTENHALDNVLMEIKGLKFAENMEFADCLHGAVPVLLSLALKKASGGGAAAPSVPALVAAIKEAIDKSVSKWGYNLLRALIQGESDEVALLEAIEGTVLQEANRKLLYPIFRLIIQICYDSDLVGEEAFATWAASRRQPSTPAEDDVRESVRSTWAERVALFKEPRVQEFVEWLDEEDESSGDDDDEDSGSGSEDS